MSADAIINLGLLIIGVIAIVGSGVWAVAAISNTTAKLSESLECLSETVASLRASVKEIQEFMSLLNSAQQRLEESHQEVSGRLASMQERVKKIDREQDKNGDSSYTQHK